MKSTLAALTLAVLAAAPRLAHAQEPPPAYPPPPPPSYAPAPLPPSPPSTGTGLIVTGAILTGVGGLNLVTAPICKTSLFQPNIQTTCLALSLGVGIAFAGAGIPLLVVGLGKRSAYQEWKKQNHIIGRLTDIGFTPTPGGAAVTWQTSF